MSKLKVPQELPIEAAKRPLRRGPRRVPSSQGNAFSAPTNYGRPLQPHMAQLPAWEVWPEKLRPRMAHQFFGLQELLSTPGTHMHLRLESRSREDAQTL